MAVRAAAAMLFSVRFRTAFPRLVRRGPGKVGVLQGASWAPLKSSRESLSYQGHSGLLREGEEREVRLLYLTSSVEEKRRVGVRATLFCYKRRA